MGEGGSKDRRRAVACAVAILREQRGMLIGVIESGRYDKITCDTLDRSFSLKWGSHSSHPSGGEYSREKLHPCCNSRTHQRRGRKNL